ncbi:MAG: ABC transporter substrate-binding protein, partial [Mycobacteriales bacterium]
MRLDRSRPLVLGTALLVLAGCGSTVQVRSTATGVLGDGLSQAQPGAAAPGSAGAVAGTTGTAASTGAVASAPTAAGATAAGAAGAQGGGGATAGPGVPTQGLGAQAATGGIPPTGRGWDRTHVYIGVTTQKDAQAAFANAGASGIDPGDQEGDANAVVAELNRRGGLFGRRIQVVFKDESTVSTAQDPNTAGSAACTYFTQDHPVVALLNPVTLMDVPSFRACMAKAHVPLLSASVAAVDDQVGRALAPYFYQSTAPSWNALAPTLMTQLKAEGYFSGWDVRTSRVTSAKPRVGVLVSSDDVGIRIGQLLTKTLADAGYPGAVVYQYAQGNTDLSAAVLQFSGNGVTHVIAADSTLVAFQLSASSQGYRPRYAVTTYNAPLGFLQDVAPKDQQVGDVGVGWAPAFDVDDQHDPGSTGPGEVECLAMLKKGGQTFTGKRLALTLALAFCDGFRLLDQGAVAGGGLSGQQLFAGIQKVAPRFSTAFSFATGL